MFSALRVLLPFSSEYLTPKHFVDTSPEEPDGRPCYRTLHKNSWSHQWERSGQKPGSILSYCSCKVLFSRQVWCIPHACNGVHPPQVACVTWLQTPG